MQQNVLGLAGSAEPMGSPPPGWHIPGMKTGGDADLLPSATPTIVSTHTGFVESTGFVFGITEEQVSSG
jgi:hypothetical protein